MESDAQRIEIPVSSHFGWHASNAFVDRRQLGVDDALRGVGRFSAAVTKADSRSLRPWIRASASAPCSTLLLASLKTRKPPAAQSISDLEEDGANFWIGESGLQHIGQRPGHRYAWPPSEFGAVVGVDPQALPSLSVSSEKIAARTSRVRCEAGSGPAPPSVLVELAAASFFS